MFRKTLFSGLLLSVVLLFTVVACTDAQRAALRAAVGAVSSPEATSAAPTTTPYASVLNTPTLSPLASGPMGTLTAIAYLFVSPTPNPEPYQIVNQGKPHFVEFGAWWCSPCNQMRPSVIRIEEQYQDRIDFHILNVDDVSTHDLAARYEVLAIPTVVLLDSEGQTVKIMVGYQTEDQLAAAVDDLLKADRQP
jgi:thiol-disulfide isomerase/thioredoxin